MAKRPWGGPCARPEERRGVADRLRRDPRPAALGGKRPSERPRESPWPTHGWSGWSANGRIFEADAHRLRDERRGQLKSALPCTLLVIEYGPRADPPESTPAPVRRAPPPTARTAPDRAHGAAVGAGELPYAVGRGLFRHGSAGRTASDDRARLGSARRAAP